jgi:hypothetical protein
MTSKAFSVKSVRDGNKISVACFNLIDDDFAIPLDSLEGVQFLDLDLVNVKGINSSGTRRLAQWASEMQKKHPSLKVRIFNVPSVVVRQLNLIRANTWSAFEVQSVFIPYYCSQCDQDDQSRLAHREEIIKSPDLTPLSQKPVICLKCGEPMELDVDPSTYFAIFVKSNTGS